MVKFLRFLPVIFILLLLVSNVIAEDMANSPYRNAMLEIEKWLDSIPEEQYKKALPDQVFQWKVKMEECNDNITAFKYKQALLEELGDMEFEYDSYIYNKKSIKYFMIYNYCGYYYETLEQRGQPIEPDDFFLSEYNYYKNNIKSKEEQFAWIIKFIEFLIDYRLVNNETFKKTIYNNCFDIVQDILHQFLYLGSYYWENDPRMYGKATTIYSNYWSGGNPEYDLLGNLEKFLKNWKDYLPDSDKNYILNTVLPKYMDSDYAVQIYTLLK